MNGEISWNTDDPPGNTNNFRPWFRKIKKLQLWGHATAYVSGNLKNGYYINAATRRTMTKPYPTKYRTKNAAIKAAKAFVLKRG